MFKIMVDGKEHTRYDDACVRVNVGSAAAAQVRLPSAAPEHLKIYPLDGSHKDCFKVTVHAPEGMTHKFRTIAGERQTVQWTPDHGNWLVADLDWCPVRGGQTVCIHGERPGWVMVHPGDSMIVMGHEIQVINYCGTCGKQGDSYWECTCHEQEMKIHLHELYRAECGLAGCLKRLRLSGELLADSV